MWDGMIYFQKNRFTDHFDVVNVKPNELMGFVEVTVVFDAKPGKEYVFEIPEEDFEPDKEAIGKQIMMQLKA